MNCQDITRLVDSGKFSALTVSERRDAEAHALSCQHCAPLWIMHASVAATPVPAIPAELSVRCLTLAAAKARAPASRQASRKIVFAITGLAVLAAAASMLLVNVANAPAPQVQSMVTDSPPEAMVATPAPQVPITGDRALTEVTPAPESVAPDAQPGPVPRVPSPIEADKAFIARQKLALEKLVEFHPELVDGPPTEGMFVAAIMLRSDGTVLTHAMKAATRESSRMIGEELGKLLPMDGGEAIGDFARKGTRVADGRALRGNLSYRHLMVSGKYDPSRSNLRVDEILRTDRAALMLPTTNAGVNYVTVLLSDKGAVMREHVEFVAREEVQQRMQLDSIERAREVARRLGVSVDQIGLMGYAPIMDAQNGRSMYVNYAWSRRAGESAPVFRQGQGQSFEDGIDPAAALALVERVMPDAFMSPDVERTLGQAVILMTEDGQFIRTARLKAGKDPEKALSDLFPGVVSNTARTVILTNREKNAAAVLFVWRAP